jgi:hypothetical protein
MVNWREYRLEGRELLFDPDYIRSCLNIPEVENKGKNGRPFTYSNSLMAFFILPSIYLGLPRGNLRVWPGSWPK